MMEQLSKRKVRIIELPDRTPFALVVDGFVFQYSDWGLQELMSMGIELIPPKEMSETEYYDSELID